jgi:hypothetical protein
MVNLREAAVTTTTSTARILEDILMEDGVVVVEPITATI